MMIRLATIALALMPALAAYGAEAPIADVSGARDPAWLKRFEGSFIVNYEHKPFDAFAFPASPLAVREDGSQRDAKNNRLAVPARSISTEGRYTRLLYIAPEDRSTLEVMRNYIEEIKANGGKSVYGCKDSGCGGDLVGNDHGGGTQGLLERLYPNNRLKDVYGSTGYCASVEDPAEQRYYLATQPDGAGGQRTIGVYVYRINSPGHAYCGVLNDRTAVMVIAVEPKPIENKMVAVSADDMADALAAAGTISLYGIYFDFNKSAVKPESRPTLEQIAKLMASQPALRLSVIGHTDNVGGADYNLGLSQRRAAAVVAALVEDYAVDSARLEPSGAGMTKPLASNADEAGRAKNRRVELAKR